MNTHVRERAIFVQSSPAFLARLDSMIEELIAMRDALDGDPDLEPEPDEDDGDAEDEPDDEVTMPNDASGFSIKDQDVDPRDRGYFTPDDHEDPHDAEDGRDDEPSLGWTPLEAATACYAPSFNEAEEDDADDEDGGDAEPEPWRVGG